MPIETVDVQAQPMLFVTRPATLAPGDIAMVMAQAFQSLGQFIGMNHVPVTGPPLAVYRDHAADGSLTIDVGFPVAASATAMASGEVKAGSTPSGRALKVVHHGPYDGLKEAYAALDAHMKSAGVPMPPQSWEVYVGDPQTAPAADLVTEIYMPLA